MKQRRALAAVSPACLVIVLAVPQPTLNNYEIVG